MSGSGDPRDVLDSEPNRGEESGLAGDTGVSSERVGTVRGTPGATTGAAQDDPQDPDARTDEEPPDPLPR